MPQDGNCTQALAHLDPFNRGEKPPCDASSPQTCQVGDLSGKYGKVTQSPFEAEYVDPFTSLKDGDQSFFGNRSFVFHFGNTTRITCANFAKVDVDNDDNSPNNGGSGSTPSAVPATGSGMGAPTSTGGVVAGPRNGTTPVSGSAAATRLSLPLVLVSVAALVFAL